MELARELKKMWNMKVVLISIVVLALGTVSKNRKTTDELEITESRSSQTQNC